MSCEIDSLEKEIYELQQEYAAVTQYPTDQYLEDEINEHNSAISSLEELLKSNSDKPKMNDCDVKRIKSALEDVTQEAEKRSKMYKNFMKLISEHLDTKSLINDLGLEDLEFQ